MDDPVVRCTECQTMLYRAEIHKYGQCRKCGARRMRNVTVLSNEERDDIAKSDFHEFLQKFEGVPDE